VIRGNHHASQEGPDEDGDDEQKQIQTNENEKAGDRDEDRCQRPVLALSRRRLVLLSAPRAVSLEPACSTSECSSSGQISLVQ
jgi:hypothetical protein